MSFKGPKGLTVDCSKDELMTKQAERDEADINKIVARMQKGEMIERLNKNEPFYGDVSAYGGLQEALIKVQEANDLFMEMDAPIRERFDNDPVKMVAFLEKAENYDEAVKLGMVVPREEEPVAPVAPVAPVVTP